MKGVKNVIEKDLLLAMDCKNARTVNTLTIAAPSAKKRTIIPTLHQARLSTLNFAFKLRKILKVRLRASTFLSLTFVLKNLVFLNFLCAFGKENEGL